jgi:hypothetical protein
MNPKTQAEHLESFPEQEESGPSNLKSFCTVATGIHGYEASLLMKSIRLQSDKKIYLITDELGERCLGEEIPDNVDITVISDGLLKKRREEFPEDLATIWPDCVNLGNLWNPAEVSLKMDIMSKAINDCGNTLFLDADVILVNPIECKFTAPLVLSPHKVTEEACAAYGVYNGGYVFSSDATFPDYWSKVFREDSVFVEQECMTRFHKEYETALFSDSHNYGLWKSSRLISNGSEEELLSELGLSSGDDIRIEGDQLISFHAHLRPKPDQRLISYNLVRAFYECLKQSTKEKHKQLLDYICSVFIPNAFRLKLGEANTVTV